MASKVLVPTAPFAKLQVKKSPPESSGSGFIIGSDATSRVAHLEHSVRFLQEQHRLMLSGLHNEIEALRERNRDLQFQLIFNKESSPKITTPASPANEDSAGGNEETVKLKVEVSRLEREAAAARGEARAAEARALQLQRLVDAQAEKLRELELQKCETCSTPENLESAESRAELRARLAEAERLVRRLRSDAERQRREVLASGAGGVTNLLFDNAAATHAHLQCMKNSLHASLRGADAGFYNHYHFPPVQNPEFWREPLRDDYNTAAIRGRGARRPLTLPELSGQQIQRSTVYANNHTRPRAYGYENKNKKPPSVNGDSGNSKSPEETSEMHRLKPLCTNDLATDKHILEPIPTYPELKIVVTKLLPQEKVTNVQTAESSGNRARPRRNHHRKQATTDHT